MKDSLEWLLDPEDGLVAAPPVSTELETLHGNLLNQLGNLQHLLNSNHKVPEELRALRLAYREDSALGLNIAEALATNSVSWSDRPYIAVCEHKNGEVSFECPTETYCHAIVECNMCTGLTRWKDYIYAPCGHALCRSCIIHYFGLVTRHESAYPPRCCLEPVPLYKVHDWLGAGLIELYLEKQLEYDTMDRTYCANKNCLAFIPSHSGRDNKFANCLKCERKTCAWCKSLEHGDEECKLDEGEQALMNLSKDTGWKKCWRCGHWWEKDGGCDHMT